MPCGDGKSHQPAQRRILTHVEAERLRQQEGQRRQSQVLDAEMKIASIHSRMAALVKSLSPLPILSPSPKSSTVAYNWLGILYGLTRDFCAYLCAQERSILSQGESDEPSAQQRLEDQASGRAPGRQMPMADKGLTLIPTGELQSEQRDITIKRSGWKAAAISTEAAEHEAQKGYANTLSKGPTQKYAMHHPCATMCFRNYPFSIDYLPSAVDMLLANFLADT